MVIIYLKPRAEAQKFEQLPGAQVRPVPRLLTSTACLDLPTSEPLTSPGPSILLPRTSAPPGTPASGPILSTRPLLHWFPTAAEADYHTFVCLSLAQISLLLVNVEEANEQRSKGPDCTPGSPEAPEMGTIEPQQRDPSLPNRSGDSQRAEPIIPQYRHRVCTKALAFPLCKRTDCKRPGRFCRWWLRQEPRLKQHSQDFPGGLAV